MTRRVQTRSVLCLGVAPVLLALWSSISFCSPQLQPGQRGPAAQYVAGTAPSAGSWSRPSRPMSQMLALPATQEADISAASRETDAAVVLLLHPGTGSPGFAELPHMGSALTGASPGWAEAAEQLVKRVNWDLGNEAVEFRSMSVAELCQADSSVRFEFILGVDLVEEPPQECAATMQQILSQTTSRMFITSSKARTTCSFWSSKTSLSGVGDEELSNPGFMGLQAAFGGYQEAAKMRNDVVDLWHRRTAEEAVYAILVLIDSAVTGLPAMEAQRPVPTSETIGRAIDRCQDAFRNCFTQPRCLQSLACLSQCGLADQSCSYRCIVSYQSQAFTDFSLCALQKQNLLNSQIERPPTPRAKPMETFRGESMTHETAENILVGHFEPNDHPHSWLVAAGSNPAYEQFALQYQLWYKGSGRNTFWYHPTFLVEALDGAKIWRTRDYRVRRRETPGMWDFSVVDNGIISEERWHLLGADDNLEWCVLFYVGVARKAGLSYRGCLVLTPEGQMPGPEHAEAITAAIARADMKPWELEATSNPPVDPANPPPLIAPETQEPAPLLRVSAAA